MVPEFDSSRRRRLLMTKPFRSCTRRRIDLSVAWMAWGGWSFGGRSDADQCTRLPRHPQQPATGLQCASPSAPNPGALSQCPASIPSVVTRSAGQAGRMYKIPGTSLRPRTVAFMQPARLTGARMTPLHHPPPSNRPSRLPANPQILRRNHFVLQTSDEAEVFAGEFGLLK